MIGVWVAVGAVLAIGVVVVLLRRGVLGGKPAEKAPEQTTKV